MVRLTYGVMILMIFLSQPAELLAQTISGELVRTAVENYIKKSVPADVDATIELRDLRQYYAVSEKQWTLAVSSANSVNMKGLVTFLVKISYSHKGIYDQTFPVTAKIRTFENVLVAIRTIQPHCKIDPDQVNLVKTESTDLQNPVTDLNQLSNKWTSRWIQNGKVLTFDMFDNEPVVKRGDDVLIMVKTKNVVVREKGSALQDGKIDEIIGITNEYRETLRGRITGKDEVVLVN